VCSFIFTNQELREESGYNNYMKPRGPDHTETGRFEGLWYTHNLLSITGEVVPQPLFDKRTMVMFNGEIYNYRDFGDYRSDVECIIPLYREYGLDFVKHLDGEFSIILYDADAGQVVIARDAFGTKPLFVANDGEDWGYATYPSALKALGFKEIYPIESNIAFMTGIVGNYALMKGLSTKHFDFSLHQTVASCEPWVEAFERAIEKRAITNVTKKIFMGLSSGYDSGAIAAELLHKGVDFQTYTVQYDKENKDVLRKRAGLLGSRYHQIDWDALQALRTRARVINKIEPYKLNLTIEGINYVVPMFSDSGSQKMHLVCEQAALDGAKIYLSGQGADEIISDYGFNGQKKFPHSCFGGMFPIDLATIFPWASFYGSTQRSYLMKEELIAGAYGLEARYPFLDPEVVQAFLNTTVEIKNSYYKSVIDHYLRNRYFPYQVGQKIGF